MYVCGGMSSRNAGEQVFIGTLSAGRFTPDRIGKDQHSIGTANVAFQSNSMRGLWTAANDKIASSGELGSARFCQ